MSEENSKTPVARFNEIDTRGPALHRREVPPKVASPNSAHVSRAAGSVPGVDYPLSRQTIHESRIGDFHLELSNPDSKYRALCVDIIRHYQRAHPELVEKVNATSPPLGGVA